MILLAICILGLGCALCWFLIPDTCAAREDDLPALGESIDRAIALAAALPPTRECANCDGVFEPELEGDEICTHCIDVGHGQIRAGRFVLRA